MIINVFFCFNQVIQNIALEVGHRCYKLLNSQDVAHQRHTEGRPGLPLQPHNKKQCAACQNGFCKTAKHLGSRHRQRKVSSISGRNSAVNVMQPENFDAAV